LAGTCISPEEMTRYAIAVAAAVLMSVRPGAAQEALTLNEAIGASVASNASLRAARAAGDEAAARVPEARAGLFPRLSFSESWQRGDQPVFVFSSLLASRQFAAANFAIDFLNHPNPTGFFHASAGAEQLLFDGGRSRARSTAAGLQRDLAQATSEQTAADLAVEVTRTFGRVLTAQATHRAADAALTSAHEDQSRAERRRDAGTATDADVLSFAARAADLRRQVIQADADAAIASAELNRLMGRPVDHLFIAVAPAPFAPGDLPALDALFAEADAHRPEVRQAALSSTLAGVERHSAHSALYPRIAAQGAVDWSGTRFNDRASAWIAGVELRWTLSTSGSEFAQRKAAAAAVSRAAALEDDTRAAVHVDVVAAVRTREAARARQAVGSAAVEQARESERVIRDRFAAGVAGVTDVLRASSALLDAEANQTSALVDVIVSDALLDRALGRKP